MLEIVNFTHNSHLQQITFDVVKNGNIQEITIEKTSNGASYDSSYENNRMFSIAELNQIEDFIDGCCGILHQYNHC